VRAGGATDAESSAAVACHFRLQSGNFRTENDLSGSQHAVDGFLDLILQFPELALNVTKRNGGMHVPAPFATMHSIFDTRRGKVTGNCRYANRKSARAPPRSPRAPSRIAIGRKAPPAYNSAACRQGRGGRLVAENPSDLVVESFKLTKIYQNRQIALNDVTL